MLVQVQLRIGDARAMVDNNGVEEFSACAAGFITRVSSDAVANLYDTGELLDVNVQQAARRSMLISMRSMASEAGVSPSVPVRNAAGVS